MTANTCGAPTKFGRGCLAAVHFGRTTCYVHDPSPEAVERRRTRNKPYHYSNGARVQESTPAPGMPLSFTECDRKIRHCWDRPEGEGQKQVCLHCGALREMRWDIKPPGEVEANKRLCQALSDAIDEPVQEPQPA